MGRTRTKIFAALTTLGTIALVLGAGEVVARVQHARRMHAIEAEYPRSSCARASDDPALVYEWKPNTCGRNSRGFLDREHALAKPPGTLRVVVIGDSVAEGQGLPDWRLAFPKVMERSLAKSLGRDVEVIVLARWGYSTSQELRLLQTAAYQYSPDLIVWSYVLNDPAHPIFHADGGPSEYFAHPRSWLWHWIERRLFFAREHARARACGSPRDYRAMLHCVYWPEVTASFAELGAIQRAHGVPMVVALMPVLTNVEYPFGDIHDAIAKLCARQNLPVVDLRDALTDKPLSRYRVGESDSWHPNEDGHRAIGVCLASWIASYERF